MPAKTRVRRYVRVTPKKRYPPATATDLSKLIKAFKHNTKVGKNILPHSDVTDQLDPHAVYEDRARKLAVESKPGLERFAYNVSVLRL